MDARQDIKELSVNQLRKLLAGNNFRPFHASQILSWIYKRNVVDFSLMSDLSDGLRAFLKNRFFICRAKISQVFSSQDGTKKFAIALDDGKLIETVFIPSESRNTICLSSQVGCRFGCFFCASASSDWVRNLTCGEILEQILLVKPVQCGERISHVVFMGIGEPLDNFDACFKAIDIINASYGFGIGKRRITISTCGIIPAIRRMSNLGLGIELSVSLHASDEQRRSVLMPINKKYPLRELIPSLVQYQKKTLRQVTFEYVLINDFNADLDCVLGLKKLLKALDYKINLIALNVIGNSRFKPATELEIKRFKSALQKEGIRVTLRQARGQDIKAACGQLRINEIKNKNK